MLYPRIIPCLLVHKKGLVKTTLFGAPKYIGDPLNAVKIFKEKEVDELIIIDIDASSEGREPDYKMIENLSAECTMPLCYGGGIKTIEQAQRIFGLGVEKIAISSAAVENPQLIRDMAQRVGNQSVVVVLDIKKHPSTGKYELYIYNGKKNTGSDPFTFMSDVQRLGAGEIVLNSIDNDGIMRGYDTSLVRTAKPLINIPLTILCGAGSLYDIGKLFRDFGVIGAAAGSLFVFKGRFKAVLINYPTTKEKEVLINGYCGNTNDV